VVCERSALCKAKARASISLCTTGAACLFQTAGNWRTRHAKCEIVEDGMVVVVVTHPIKALGCEVAHKTPRRDRPTYARWSTKTRLLSRQPCPARRTDWWRCVCDLQETCRSNTRESEIRETPSVCGTTHRRASSVWRRPPRLPRAIAAAQNKNRHCRRASPKSLPPRNLKHQPNPQGANCIAFEGSALEQAPTV
jgi:hypothetical protein